jgi:hypothetical protein
MPVSRIFFKRNDQSQQFSCCAQMLHIINLSAAIYMLEKIGALLHLNLPIDVTLQQMLS